MEEQVPEFRYHFFEEGIPFSILNKITVTPIAGIVLAHSYFPISVDLTRIPCLQSNMVGSLAVQIS